MSYLPLVCVVLAFLVTMTDPIDLWKSISSGVRLPRIDFVTRIVVLFASVLLLHCGQNNEVESNVCLPNNVVVLTYHAINDVNPHHETRHVADFVNDLDFLVSQGYAFDTLEGLKEKIEHSAAITKTIILNFDDGLSEHLMAAEELFARNLPGEFFIPTFHMNTPEYLTWEQVEQMTHLGVTIDSHNYHHEMMGVRYDGESDETYYARVSFEMNQSKEDLQAHGIETSTYAFPGGSGINDPKIIQIGLDAGFTIIRGVASSVQRFIPGVTVQNLYYLSMNTDTDLAMEVENMMNQPSECL